MLVRLEMKKNAERVAKESNNRLAYVHIPSMDDDGLEKFVRGLYSDAADKEGLIIDLRNNGGGFTHDKVLAYLGAKAHHIFRQREGGEGLVMRANDRKWNKPVVVLINNRSYSDAEILPSAIRALGLGKLVGQPTGGMVISTYQTQLIDGSSFRIPTGGVYSTQGVNLEKEGASRRGRADSSRRGGQGARSAVGQSESRCCARRGGGVEEGPIRMWPCDRRRGRRRRWCRSRWRRR